MHTVGKVAKTFLTVLLIVSGILVIENLFIMMLTKLWDFFTEKLGTSVGHVALLGIIVVVFLYFRNNWNISSR